MSIETAYSELAQKYTGEGWIAVTDNYDGAPDSDHPIGRGNSEESATEDLLDKLREAGL